LLNATAMMNIPPMMKHTAWIAYVGLAFGLGLATGCKSDEQKAFEAEMDQVHKEIAAEKAAEAKRKPIDVELFGKTVAAPSGPLSKLRIGMPVAEARAAAPELFEDEDGYQLVDHPDYKDTNLGVGLDHDTKSKVSSLDVSFPTVGKDVLVAAWGPGIEGKDTIDKPIVYWFNPATGWRAILGEGFDNLKVEFDQYTPYEKLLGEGKDKLGFEPQSTLGATAADIKARFGALAIERNQAQAEADRKNLEAFAEQKLDDLGAPKPDIKLELPPTEYESYLTTVNFHFDEANKVESLRVGISYAGVPAAKEQIFAAIKKKWGEPKEIEEYGQKVLLFNENPRVEVEDDTIINSWDITISPLAPPE
jgi:hypothetical protein